MCPLTTPPSICGFQREMMVPFDRWKIAKHSPLSLCAERSIIINRFGWLYSNRSCLIHRQAPHVESFPKTLHSVKSGKVRRKGLEGKTQLMSLVRMGTILSPPHPELRCEMGKNASAALMPIKGEIGSCCCCEPYRCELCTPGPAVFV